MYRTQQCYEELVRVIIDIYLDYGIKEFPLDEKRICSLLGVALVPYSECSEETQELLMKRSIMGFFVKGTAESPPTIYYNDQFRPYGAVRLTIFHEIKHYVFNEDSRDEELDDTADFFGRFFLCPIPFLLMKGIKTETEIIAGFGVSDSVASNVASNLEIRKKKYGYKVFDHEVPLLKLLDNTAYEVFVKSHLGGDSIEG